jgi:hypothetical protein
MEPELYGQRKILKEIPALFKHIMVFLFIQMATSECTSTLKVTHEIVGVSCKIHAAYNRYKINLINNVLNNNII